MNYFSFTSYMVRYQDSYRWLKTTGLTSSILHFANLQMCDVIFEMNTLSIHSFTNDCSTSNRFKRSERELKTKERKGIFSKNISISISSYRKTNVFTFGSSELRSTQKTGRFFFPCFFPQLFQMLVASIS